MSFGDVWFHRRERDDLFNDIFYSARCVYHGLSKGKEDLIFLLAYVYT